MEHLLEDLKSLLNESKFLEVDLSRDTVFDVLKPTGRVAGLDRAAPGEIERSIKERVKEFFETLAKNYRFGKQTTSGYQMLLVPRKGERVDLAGVEETLRGMFNKVTKRKVGTKWQFIARPIGKSLRWPFQTDDRALKGVVTPSVIRVMVGTKKVISTIEKLRVDPGEVISLAIQRAVLQRKETAKKERALKRRRDARALRKKPKDVSAVPTSQLRKPISKKTTFPKKLGQFELAKIQSATGNPADPNKIARYEFSKRFNGRASQLDAFVGRALGSVADAGALMTHNLRFIGKQSDIQPVEETGPDGEQLEPKAFDVVIKVVLGPIGAGGAVDIPQELIPQRVLRRRMKKVSSDPFGDEKRRLENLKGELARLRKVARQHKKAGGGAGFKQMIKDAQNAIRRLTRQIKKGEAA